MRAQPLINCHDVQASSRWYQPLLGHRELWIRDPDGYTVVIVSPDGDPREARQAAHGLPHEAP